MGILGGGATKVEAREVVPGTGIRGVEEVERGGGVAWAAARARLRALRAWVRFRPRPGGTGGREEAASLEVEGATVPFDLAFAEGSSSDSEELLEEEELELEELELEERRARLAGGGWVGIRPVVVAGVGLEGCDSGGSSSEEEEEEEDESELEEGGRGFAALTGAGWIGAGSTVVPFEMG